jgi:hypothetical protein
LSCSVLTPDRVQRLLDGTLDENARGVLRKHFEAPCEACLDRLQSVDAGRLLLALAGPAASLTGQEADQLFAHAVGDAPTEHNQAWHQELSQRFPMPMRLAAVFGVIVLLALAPMMINRPAARVETGAPGITLAGSEVGADAPQPKPLAERSELSARDQVVLRFTLTQPAHVYLWVIANDRAALAWSPEPGQQPFSAGEHPIEREGHALSLDPASLTSDGRLAIVAVASPEPLKAPDRLDPRTTEFSRGCLSCTASRLELTLK